MNTEPYPVLLTLTLSETHFCNTLTNDWIKLTWTKDDAVISKIKGIMDRSLDNFIYLQTPFGLPVTVDVPMHYHPALETSNGSYWIANSEGIGYDRSSIGSEYVSQYHEPNRQMFNNIETCPQDLLLIFHFINWGHKIDSHETFYDLFLRNRASVEKMRSDANLWEKLKSSIDPRRHKRLVISLKNSSKMLKSLMRAM